MSKNLECSGRRRSANLPQGRFAAIALVLALGACSSIEGDNCAVGHSEKMDRPDDGACSGSFLSALNQRSVLFTGEDNPKLYNGAAPRKGDIIDTGKINAPPGGGVQVAGYSGTMRRDVTVDPAVEARDMAEVRSVAGKTINPSDRVSINFNNANYDYVLKQLLGGALGVNYMVSPGLTGSVTFRTEEPVPKGQLLQIVRDILARDGLLMRLSNGVYHVGPPAVIAAIDNGAAAARPGDQTTRTIKLKKGSALEYVTFMRQLLPDYMQLEAAGPDTIVVRGPSTELDKTEQLIASLSARGIGDDRVAIIPLRQSAPEKVAAKLLEFYRSRTTSPLDAVSIVPLENQQALLVGARDPRMMEGVRQLASELDRNLSDEVSLRIITLQYLNAEQTAQQLIAILGSSGNNGGASKVSAAEDGRGRNGKAQVPGPIPPRARPPSAGSDPEDDGSGLEAPSFNAPGVKGGGGGGRNARDGGGRDASETTGNVVVSGSGEGIRIAGDARNNTIMVYSNFGTFKRVRDVVRALDVPQAQVVIESTVLEVQINDNLQYGVQWFLSGKGIQLRNSTLPTATDPTGAGASLLASGTVGDFKVSAVLSALQAVTNVKVLSSPYLTVVDGSSARLQIGDQIPFATATQQSNNLGQVTVTQQIEVKDTGIILEVTPKIRPNDGVLLSINQTVSRPQETVLAGNVTPVIANRQMKSDIVVQSGHTALLGGLIQERHEKAEGGVPVLKNVPVMGQLFKTTSDRVGRVEMLIMITPRVVRKTSEIDNITKLLHNSLYPNYMPR